MLMVLPSSNLQLAEAGGLGRCVFSCCTDNIVTGATISTRMAIAVCTTPHPKDFDCNLEKTISPVSSECLLADTVQPNERTILSPKVVMDLKNVGVHAVLQRCHLAKVGIEAFVIPDQKFRVPIRLQRFK